MTDEEGKKKIILKGKWDSYLDMQKCDEEGAALPGAELVRLWTVSQPLGIAHFDMSFPVIKCSAEASTVHFESSIVALSRLGAFGHTGVKS